MIIRNISVAWKEWVHQIFDEVAKSFGVVA